MSNYDAGNSQLLSFLFFLHKLCYHLLCTYLSSFFLWAPRKYVHHGFVLRIDWTSCQLSSTCIFLVCLGPPSISLFVPTICISHVHPPLTSGQLNTSIQVNNVANSKYFISYKSSMTLYSPPRPLPGAEVRSTCTFITGFHLDNAAVCIDQAMHS